MHTYWDDPSGARVTAEIDQSVSMGLPPIVGANNPDNYLVPDNAWPFFKQFSLP